MTKMKKQRHSSLSKKQPLPHVDKYSNKATESISTKLTTAFSFHQKGHLEQAQKLYEEILRIQPKHFDALQLLATIFASKNALNHAINLFNQALLINPNHVVSLNNRGNALCRMGQPKNALDDYKKAIAIKPDYSQAFNNYGNALLNLKRTKEALNSYNQAIKINPSYAEAFYNRGVVLHRINHHTQALDSYNQAIKINPDYTDALINRGNVLLDLKHPRQALNSYNQALLLNPNYPEAFYNRGNALRELKQTDQALDSYNQAIAINPNYIDALNSQGNILLLLGHPEQALKSYNHTLKIEPNQADALYNKGNALLELNLPKQALDNYEQALIIEPNSAKTHFNKGNAFRDINDYEQALTSYAQAVSIKPNYAEAFNNHGNSLIDLNRPKEALNSYNQAIKINSNYTEALYNLGNAFRDLNLHSQALDNYNKALSIEPNHIEALYNKANAFCSLKHPELALDSYDQAISLNPNYDFLFGSNLSNKMTLCDWTDIEIQFEQLAEKITQNKKASAPFPVLAISSDLALQKKAAEIFMQTQLPANLYTPDPAKFTKHNKIHIGYFSADFHNHATAYLMAELFELHDKLQFELTAFSFGPDKHDEMRQRLTPAFHSFLDVRNKSDKEIALLARSLEIDIAIDLKGFTKDSRPGIFAFRAAPIQVNYLGYPGTMATEYIDYLIADPTLIPESHQKHYTEKIIYLPNSYQANDAKRYIADTTFTRSELGLPPTGFVFCCFNNNYKITPNTFSSWMRILKQTDGSVLWLLKDHQQTVSNLREEAKSRGINPERLIFADRMPLPEHLARHRLADLFLDTLPYNAHTTASDALWAGLPVLTCLGETFAGRVAASLLTAIHLPELITSSTEMYETLAINLANNPDKLDNIKTKLNNNRLTTPLFNASLFSQHLEIAYTDIYHHHLHEKKPKHIYIPA